MGTSSPGKSNKGGIQFLNWGLGSWEGVGSIARARMAPQGEEPGQSQEPPVGIGSDYAVPM